MIGNCARTLLQSLASRIGTVIICAAAVAESTIWEDV